MNKKNKNQKSWNKIDAKHLLAKHGKLGLADKESTVPDSMIDAIADSIEKDGDYTIPKEAKTDLSTQSFPTPKTRLRVIDAETEKQAMIDQYVKQNGSIIVPDGQSAAEHKKKLESNKESSSGSDGLICG